MALCAGMVFVATLLAALGAGASVPSAMAVPVEQAAHNHDAGCPSDSAGKTSPLASQFCCGASCFGCAPIQQNVMPLLFMFGLLAVTYHMTIPSAGAAELFRPPKSRR